MRNEKAGHFLPVADAPGRHLLLAVPRVFRGFSVAARVQHVLASQDGLELVLVDDTGSIILREGLGESGPPPLLSSRHQCSCQSPLLFPPAPFGSNCARAVELLTGCSWRSSTWGQPGVASGGS
ncbi:MAG: hypothetical protein AB1445_13360 [Bacillota bacterium]